MTQQPRRGRPSRAAVHERLAFEVRELREHLGGLPSPEEAEAVWSDIWHEEAHNSTALEGNTLVKREVELLLEQGKAVGAKTLSEYLEVKGYGDAALWVYRQALGGDWKSGRLLTIAEVRHVHRLAMTPVWDVSPHPRAFDSEAPGNWRRHDIEAFARGMKPPDHVDVGPAMLDWVASVCRSGRGDEPIAERVADRHAEFERIHPFLDGNGRAGRLLMNLVLVRLGYPPVVIDRRQRSRYLDALHRADRGDIGPLGEMVARSLLFNLNRFVLPALAGPARLVPLDALATQALGAAALRAAAERGRLRAVRGSDARWRTTKKWVDEYVASRYGSLRRRREDRQASR